ncbi:MAG: transcription antitermination factor NusB, partial [Pseudomonadota bacterium]
MSQDAATAAPETRAPHADRREALRLLSAALERGRALSEAAAEAPADLSPADRARALSLAAETLRRLGQADAVIRRFARRAPPPPARDALRLAATEIHGLGAPAHAAADGAVAATKARPGGDRAAGFVNAVARKLAEPEGAAAWAAGDPARINAPGWLWGRLSSAYGKAAAHAICAAHLTRPRLDLSLADADGAWAERLLQAFPDAAARLPTGGLRLDPAAVGAVSALPGFEAGAWWVQDAAAAVPARLLAPPRGAR